MSIFPEYLYHLEDQIMILWHDSINYFKNHRHNFLEFLYVVEGEGVEYINDVKHDLCPNTFSMVLPYQVHMLKSSEKKPMKFYCVAIGLETVFTSFNSKGGIKEFLMLQNGMESFIAKFDEPAAAKIKVLLDRMYEEYTIKENWWLPYIKATLTEILILFNRTIEITMKQNINHKSDSGNQKIFWEMIYFLYANFNEEITLVSLSKKYNLSNNYISSGFSKYFGENFLTFLNSIRIKHSCALLKSTEMKITDIAYTCGYKSYRSFVRVFENVMGETPSKFRKK
jgi:AraC-like DNA-binding protein